MSEPIEPTVETDFTFGYDEPFRLSGGGTLQPVTLRYALYGELNEARDNALLVCHALSGSARVGGLVAGTAWPGATVRYNALLRHRSECDRVVLRLDRTTL